MPRSYAPGIRPPAAPATVAAVTDLLLVRHGETDWNREHRVQGHTDVPLNARGRAQADALAGRLADVPLVAVYSSDLSRAYETAVAVVRDRALEVTVDARLREKNFGSWEGLTDLEIAERFPDAVRGGWGDGETTDDVSARVVEIIEVIRARHGEGSVLVVSHGGALRAILAHLDVEHGPIRNCDVFRVAT
jgi:broad specificity phosphatase PhoE